MPSGCLDVWVPLEMRGCPSSGLEAPLVPLVLTAGRATPDLKGRWAWWVLEDNRDLRDKREKRVSVESTHTGSTQAAC